MGMIQARLFSWLQEADFYREFHQEAVEKLAPGNGGTWIDVGCGPGLLTRLAARRSYQAIGVDADRAMVETAQRIADSEGSSARFVKGTLADLSSVIQTRGKVVSAASLLAVLDDKRAGLQRLWSQVAPRGTLLIIEPTSSMTRGAASDLIGSGEVKGGRTIALKMWVSAREGGAVNPKVFEGLVAVAEKRFFPLLHGLVGLWLFVKKA